MADEQPEMPDFSKMSNEELDEYLAELRKKNEGRHPVASRKTPTEKKPPAPKKNIVEVDLD